MVYRAFFCGPVQKTVRFNCLTTSRSSGSVNATPPEIFAMNDVALVAEVAFVAESSHENY